MVIDKQNSIQSMIMDKDHIKQVIHELDPKHTHIYKTDISWAFHDLRIDPRDLDMLGIKYNDYYIDEFLPFRSKLRFVFFQHCLDAINFTMNEKG